MLTTSSQNSPLHPQGRLPTPLEPGWAPATRPHPHSPSPLCCRGAGPIGQGAESPLQPLSPLPQTLLVEFYKGAPDLVKFQEPWSQDQTYLDKLKVGMPELGGKEINCCGFHPPCSSLVFIFVFRPGAGQSTGNRGAWVDAVKLGVIPPQGSLASRTPKDQSFTHALEQIYSLLKLSG